MLFATYKHYRGDDHYRRELVTRNHAHAALEAAKQRALMGGPLCGYDEVTVFCSASECALPERCPYRWTI